MVLLMSDSFKPKQCWMATKLGIAAIAWLLCASVVFLSALTQPSPKPFTKDEIIKLLAGDVPVKRVETLARERGIDFQITLETESELRKAGASEPLLAALRNLAPKQPTLVVTTTPGGAQVFVDDELIARTSADGRLKISSLAPGPHKLRVSLDGYRDHEEIVDLGQGKTLEISASLELNTQTTRPAADSAELGATGASSPHGSVEGRMLAFAGRIGYGEGPKPNLVGTLTIGNGKLQFSPGLYGAQSWEVPLSNVVPQGQWASSVRFDVQFSDKKQQYVFQLYDRRAAEEPYAALNAGAFT
jgi:hypothetical protein